MASVASLSTRGRSSHKSCTATWHCSVTSPVVGMVWWDSQRHCLGDDCEGAICLSLGGHSLFPLMVYSCTGSERLAFSCKGDEKLSRV